jgi:DNA-binding SARP family transcriptional activator
MPATGVGDSLVILALGRFEIRCHGVSLSDRLAAKEQALLAYLACHSPQRLPREHVATLLWGETRESRARYNLRRALWSLRRALAACGVEPSEILDSTTEYVSVPGDAPISVDSSEFERAVRVCLAESASGNAPDQGRADSLRRACGLYRDQFLAGFDPGVAPAFEEWQTNERERLHVVLLRALSELVRSLSLLGARSRAIETCARLVTLDPLNEEAHRMLMRLYWENGQRSEALRQYRACREVLRTELGVPPVEETEEVYRRVLQFDPPAAGMGRALPSGRVTAPVPPPESLVRPRLFGLLERGLSTKLTLVSAPPGYGKTTLLAQWIGSAERSKGAASRRLGRVAWYAVDDADNEPGRFVEGLAASLSRIGPMRGHLAWPDDSYRRSDSIPGLLGLVGSMLNDVAEMNPAPFALVLDDVQTLTEPESLEIVGNLWEAMPVNGHVYLLTQVDPPLPLARLRVRGHLLEIREGELSFTETEAAEFLGRSPGLRLSRVEVDQLVKQAEGWVAPLWLAANALSRFTATLDDVWNGLFSYLEEEVMARQSPRHQVLLLRASALNLLASGPCGAVVAGHRDEAAGHEFLEYLLNRNLFTRRAQLSRGAGRTVYAFHPIFLTFLRERAGHVLSRSEVEQLHGVAAVAWERESELEQAMYHWQQLGDESETSRLRHLGVSGSSN